MAIKIPVSRKCMIVGCESLVKANDLCAMHYQRSLRHDGFTGETHTRGACSVDGCEKPHAAKGLCSFHYYRLQRSGTIDDPARGQDRICEIDGCGKPHVASGLCRTHYMRMKRHGDVVQTRASDWGARERHPLYTVWNALVRTKAKDICDRWKDLWAFVEDIGDSRPSIKHRLIRQDSSQPYGPGNVYWREQVTRGWSDDKKSAARDYAKKYYDTNKRKVWDVDLKKRYGIGADDYERMFEEQGGTCAICFED